jgi:phosphate transport system substrate-binding protein
MKPEVEKKAPGKLHHIPTTIGAVTVAFNVPGVTQLKLDGETIADIFLGDIKKWNDPKIAASNEGVKLPDQDITVVYRSDGSGTTAVFTDYLAKVEPEFGEKVGVGKAVRWPVGLGAKGNEGVTGQIKVTPGAIGYIELAYALQNKLSIAAVKNKAGNYVEPTVDAITAAAAGAELPDSLHTSLANPEGEKSYPISSFTYLLVYQDAKDKVKGEALARFVWWAVHDGQKFSSELHYAPLPAPVVKKVEEHLKGLAFEGQALLSEI